jgi:hypothetical protein
MLVAPERGVSVGTHTPNVCAPMACNSRVQEALHGAQAVRVLRPGRFKSIIACVLVGEVGLNFYTMLDEAS